MPLSVLALFLAALAGACPVCEAPPAPSRIPSAVFDTRGDLALTPAELELLDAGFRKKDTFYSDPAADADTHLLTNERALRFVTESQVRTLREKQDLDAADRLLASRLYWTRGQSLTEKEAAFLRLLNPLGLKPPAEEGDSPAGGDQVKMVKAGFQAMGLGGPVGGVDPQRSAKALDGLKRVVTRESHGDPAQRDLLEEALKRICSTPTGVELAEEFIKLNKPAKISFEVTGPAGGVVEQNGRKILQTSGGNMDASSGQPNVRLNKEYLKTSPGWRENAVASTLAHELLGHGLIYYKSKAAGVEPVNRVYRGDEAMAGLTGWLMDAELGQPLSNGHMWRYMADPEEYHKGLKLNLPYYAGTFSTAEMKAPLTALLERRKAAAAELKRLPAQREEVKDNQKLIDHFVGRHGLDRKKVKTLEEGLQNQRVWHDAHEKNLKEIDEYVKKKIDYFVTDAGRKEALELFNKADDPYFKADQARADLLAQRLKARTKGKAQESAFPPPPAGQLTWADLHVMLAQDKKDNPSHWP
jgi:hypothetical protein